MSNPNNPGSLAARTPKEKESTWYFFSLESQFRGGGGAEGSDGSKVKYLTFIK